MLRWHPMPKDITHWILAEKAYQGLETGSVLKKIIEPHKNLYMTGAIILDTPFYVIFGQEGKMMHLLAEGIHDTVSNSYDVLTNLLTTYEDTAPDAVIALVLGIITHIHADAIFHPFIYHFSGTGASVKKERKRHHTLEVYLSLYVKNMFKLPVADLLSDILLNVEMEKASFMAMLSNLFSINQRVDSRTVKKAVHMNSFIQGLFDKNLPRMILNCLNFLPGMNVSDYVALFYPHSKPDPGKLFPRNTEYRHPVTGDKRVISVESLAHATLDSVKEIFGILEASGKKKRICEALSSVRGPNLYTGLPDAAKRDMTFFNLEKDIMTLIF